MTDHPSQKRGRDPAAQHPQPQTSKKAMVRRRTILACEECRLRKRRCNGAIPACEGCTKRRSPCIYSSEVEAREWNQSMIQSLRARLEELERNVGAGMPPRDTVQPQALAQASYVLKTTDSASADRDRPDKDRSEAEAALFAHSPPAIDVDMFNDPDKSPAPAASSPTLQHPSVVKQNRYPSRCIEPSNFEQLMKPIGLAIDRRTDASKSPASAVPSDCGMSPSPEASTPPSAWINCGCHRLLDAVRCHLPLRRQADSLVAIYFARHARMFPVLHRPTFMTQYEALWESRADAERDGQRCVRICKQKSKGKLFPATVNTVFALAGLFSSRHPERNVSYAAEFFRLAEAIDILDLLNDEVGLEFVQLALLMAFYLQSTERFSKCWNMAGFALRMAQNMGLHFSFAEARKRGLLPSPPTQLECEMRTRVWYACILVETEISMTFAQPLMVPVGSKSIKLPQAIDDSRLSDDVGKWNVQPRDLPSLLEYYVHALKLYDILGQVLDRQQSRADTDTDAPVDLVWTVRAILSLDSKIMEWRDDLPPYLRCDTSLAECDSFERVPNLEPVSDTDVVLDFPALSRRLHCSFLCVRQVILRPALDLLFERQQQEKPVTATEPSTKKKAKGELKVCILTNIAAQCVLCAVDLVEFLASQIETENFICWWYNIHYLHTSGSTILLGRLCTFDEGTVPPDSLLASWDLCLHHLARYDNMSTVAQKSSRLLRESAKRLLLSQNEGTTDERHDGHQPFRTVHDDHTANGFIHETETAQYSTTAADEVLDNLLGGGDEASSTLQEFPFAANETEPQLPWLEGNDVWNTAPFGCPSWVFMPPISQLETFPLHFEGSNFP